jgi:HEAT repeat protein
MKLTLLNPLLVAGLLAWTSFAVNADEEQDLLGILGSDASHVQKADAAGRLRIVGTTRSVPVLAALLDHEATAHAARHALEGIPFPEAGAALRQALEQASGLTRLGLVDSLRWRGEPEAVPLLEPWLVDNDVSLAAASATALGRIGGDDALAALQEAHNRIPTAARPALLEALLRCAEQQLENGQRARATGIYRALFLPTESELIRVAAYGGMIRSADDGGFDLILSALLGNDTAAATAALQLAGDFQNPGATRVFVRLLSISSPDRQIALLALLQARGDRAALPDVLTVLGSADPSVRAAAASALGVLGDATCVALLAETATSTDPAEQSAARQALVTLRRGDITSALTSALMTAPPAVQVELVRALSARSDPSAVPALFELAGEESSPARRAALQALGQLVDGNHMGDIVLLLVNSKSPAARAQVRGVFEALIERTADAGQLDLHPILSGLTSDESEVREALLPVSVLFVDERIRAALRLALQDSNEAIRNTAIRALCTSSDPQLLPDLLELARETTDAGQRSLALDGTVRLATDEGAALSKPERVDALAMACALATRAEEKRMILSGLARVPHPTTLGLAEQACADSTVRAEAELACLQIARGLGTSEFSVVESALARLISNTSNASVRTNAQALLKQLDSGWLCAGPYRIAGKQGPELFDVEFAPELPNAATVSWQRAPGSADLARVGEVDLAGIVGGDHAVAYAKTRVYVPTAQTVVFAIGSDDGIKLWVNGALVHANNAVRGLTPDQDRATGQLREGWNDLLAKITQHTVGCGFTLRMISADGAEISDLRWSRE